MRTNIFAIVVGIGLAGTAGVAPRGAAGADPAAASAIVPAAVTQATAVPLPTVHSIRSLLDVGTHFSEFVEVPVGRSSMSAYVSYPDRAGKAPAVLLSADDGMSDWLRAIAVQLSRTGFIAVVPDSAGRADRSSGGRTMREYAAQLPASNGTVARMDVSSRSRGFEVRIDDAAGVARFPRDDGGWQRAIAYLREQTHDGFVPPATDFHALMEHASHAADAAQQAGAASPGSGANADSGSVLTTRYPDLPPHQIQSAAALANSPRRSEWADIPIGSVKLHTWVVYPEGNGPAPIVVVIHGGGYGFNDWIRAMTDQLAREGFIALAPDLLSGMGPNGGNTDSFRFPDDITKSMGKLGPVAGLARVKAVREYGLKLPRANGKSATLGFCFGGGQSFLMAAEGVNAAVVFYGAAPRPDVMARITAPVIGFYGEDDARLTAGVAPAVDAMKQLNKAYEPHIYRHATHAFLQFQDLGDNFPATQDAWPRAITFLKQYTK